MKGRHWRYTKKGYNKHSPKWVRYLKLVTARYDSKEQRWVGNLNKWNPAIYIVFLTLLIVEVCKAIMECLDEVFDEFKAKDFDFSDTDRYWSVRDIGDNKEE